MHDNVLKIFSINLQPVPDPRNVIEGSNELIFLMWVAVTLPSNEVRMSICCWSVSNCLVYLITV